MLDEIDLGVECHFEWMNITDAFFSHNQNQLLSIKKFVSDSSKN